MIRDERAMENGPHQKELSELERLYRPEVDLPPYRGVNFLRTPRYNKVRLYL
ncbi:unnamed protein product [Gongylonema pulchrum]|uniref:Transposase n=1 Tax=Gongylonema pulchrum TaxID=637853 RepID=A0A183EX47_9BILA|nr:unnamed protein product [Gongylonema pulchrum]